MFHCVLNISVNLALTSVTITFIAFTRSYATQSAYLSLFAHTNRSDDLSSFGSFQVRYSAPGWGGPFEVLSKKKKCVGKAVASVVTLS